MSQRDSKQPPPLIDPAAVAESLRLIVGAGNVVEVRCLEAWDDNPRWTKTFAGYFDDFDAAARELRNLRGAKGVYFTLNPVEPDLIARAANRLKVQGKGESTGDSHIVTRRWLPIDCDPRRPSGISASDAEHAAALDRATAISAYLTTLGWPEPIVADSGNGAHLLYRIDQPADDGGLVKRVLDALAERFNDDEIEVDTSVSNPARIWKLYGSLACKGDSTADRPHRRASIVSTPTDLAVVTTEQLVALAGLEEPAVLAPTIGPTGPEGSFDVEVFIERNGLQVDQPRPWQGGLLWTLRVSPLCDHGGDGPFIARHASGAVVAKCQHNSCGWSWQDLRAALEPRTGEGDGSTCSKPAVRYADPALADLDPLEPPGEAPPAWKPFPTRLLPDPLRTLVVEGAKAIGCDEAFVALPGLAVAAGSIGATRTVRIKRGWTEPAVLWCVVVSPSGATKSQGRKLFLTSLLKRQREAERDYERHVREFGVLDLEYQRELAQWKKGKDDGPPPEPPEKPQPVELFTSDATVESMARLLAANPRGVLLECDELAAWFRTFNLYNGGKGADAQHWINFHGAGHVKVNRAGLAKPIFMERAAASVSGTIQPELLAESLRGEHTASGFAARLVMAEPPRRQKRWTDAEVSDAAEAAIAARMGDLLDLEFGTDEEGEPFPVSLSLSTAARRRMKAFVNQHGEEALDRDGAEAAAWSKLEGYAARLALILQLIDDPEAVEVSDDWLAAGIELSRWFGNEAARFYRGSRVTVQQRADEKLVAWIEAQGGTVSAREVQQGRRSIKTAAEAEAALDRLAAAGFGGWRPVEAGQKGGRPMRRFQLTGASTSTQPRESRDPEGSVDVDTPGLAENAAGDDGWEAA